MHSADVLPSSRELDVDDHNWAHLFSFPFFSSDEILDSDLQITLIYQYQQDESVVITCDRISYNESSASFI
ncbi:unnamed protein product [Calypogeia fissa]